MAEQLIVKSKIAELIRSQSMMISAETYDALNEFVDRRLKQACKRCEANGRKTVKPYDF